MFRVITVRAIDNQKEAAALEKNILNAALVLERLKRLTLGLYPNGGKEKESSCLSYLFYFNLRRSVLFFMERSSGNNPTYAS